MAKAVRRLRLPGVDYRRRVLKLVWGRRPSI